MRLGEKIKKIRIARRWNQEQLAIRAGLSKSTIYNAEAALGAWDLNPKTIDQIAFAFGITIEQLVAGQGIEIWQRWQFDESAGGYADIDPAFLKAGSETDDEPILTSGVKDGMDFLPTVLKWFRALSPEDRTAVINALDAYSGNILTEAARVVREVVDRHAESPENLPPNKRRKAAS